MESVGRGRVVGAAVVMLALAIGAGCGDHEDERLLCTCLDSNIDAIDPTACDPLAQTGCALTEKCTWVWEQLPPFGQTTPTPDGEITCVANATLPLNADCGPRQLGGDRCASGLACIEGRCEAICDPLGGGAGATCDADQVCTTHAPEFERGGVVIAGVCDPRL
jgi:hypothetical protein